jgi:hypothetical protein
MKLFNPTSSHPERALQAWIILVSTAKNRQTITYLGLSRLMYGKDAAGVLDKILGHIAYFCEYYEPDSLPPLTSIVVGKYRGTPGKDIPVDMREIDQRKEEVYEYDWYNVYPPTVEELAKAFRQGMKD